jgi:hypothetical protein
VSAQERIDSLLLLWQDKLSQGQDLSAGELCRDCPELEQDLGEQIRILRHVQGLLAVPGLPAAETLPEPKPVAPVSAPEQQTMPGQESGHEAVPASKVPGHEILKELGRGGMGVVYLARQTRLGRLVALKMILGGGHVGPADLQRFRTEAEAAARLQHPNIVQLFEVGEHEGQPYFSLEFCPGGSLDKKLAGSPLPPEEAAKLAETLARAMQAAHQAHVIHRDLSSRPTCCWRPTARPRSPTSGWPRSWTRRARRRPAR